MRRGALLFCLISCWSLPAFGQATPKTPSSLSEEESTKRYEEAVGLYNVQEFQKALAIFKELYLQTRAPELLVNIAQCHRYLKNYDDSISAFKAYLRESPQSPYRAEIEKLIATMEAEKKTASTQPATQPTATIPTTKEALPESAPSTETPKKPLKPSLFFGGAAGLVALSLGAGGLALARLNEAEDTASVSFGEPIETDKITALEQRARFFQNTANALFAASLVSGGVGLYLHYANKKTEAKVTPVVGTINGAALTLVF